MTSSCALSCAWSRRDRYEKVRMCQIVIVEDGDPPIRDLLEHRIFQRLPTYRLARPIEPDMPGQIHSGRLRALQAGRELR